ncbi:hypothetical protein AMTR_s00004p00269370 [Amborella trichopoda]|uniref:Phytocyanin domain-containing protein n=2 Tax=Amborella trichopoda TaxID=13333 RepID=W1NF54_AMBTC|nr:hypothetical protein AMTR_s00004p00269370 [Amborella trichopoda]
MASSKCDQKRVLVLLGFFCMMILFQETIAMEFQVGGKNGWSVPSDPTVQSYNQWAEKSRFQIGDSLLFVYSLEKDSVLQVTKDDYSNCNTGSPIAPPFKDGHTSFKFNHSGPYYFISGVKENCQKNEKLLVIVMADRTAKLAAPLASPPLAASPPAPATTSPPPLAASPPAPAGPNSSAPILSPTMAPTTETESPNKNVASFLAETFLGLAGAIGSSILFLIF